MDLTSWACLDCESRFAPANPQANLNPCPGCEGTLTFPVVPVTEIGA